MVLEHTIIKETTETVEILVKKYEEEQMTIQEL